MPATLNRKKPFGEVCGIAPYKYEQGGRFFDQQGNEVDKRGRPIVLEPQKPISIEIGHGETNPALPTLEIGDEIKVVLAGEGLQGAGDASKNTEEAAEDDYGTRDDIMKKLEQANIPYNPKSRRSALIELLKGKEG